MAAHDLTAQERRALALVQKVAGRRWKASLRKAWEGGTLACLVGMTGPVDVLQRLRGKLGPAGLAKVRLDEEC